jgi:hypothetical protein
MILFGDFDDHENTMIFCFHLFQRKYVFWSFFVNEFLNRTNVDRYFLLMNQAHKIKTN